MEIRDGEYTDVIDNNSLNADDGYVSGGKKPQGKWESGMF